MWAGQFNFRSFTFYSIMSITKLFKVYVNYFQKYKLIILSVLITNLAKFIDSFAKLRLKACVKVFKNSGAKPPNTCRSSIGSAVCHLIRKLHGEHCSPENSGSASTKTQVLPPDQGYGKTTFTCILINESQSGQC